MTDEPRARRVAGAFPPDRRESSRPTVGMVADPPGPRPHFGFRDETGQPGMLPQPARSARFPSSPAQPGGYDAVRATTVAAGTPTCGPKSRQQAMTNIIEEFFPCDPDNMSPPVAGTFIAWREGFDAGPGPNWRSVDLTALPNEIIPWTVLVDVHGTRGCDMVYRFWGGDRIVLSGNDMTGRTVDDLRPEFLRRRVVAQYQQILETGDPIYSRVTVPRTKGAITYENLRLPLSRNGRDITGLLSTVQFDGRIYLTSDTLFAEIGRSPRDA